MEYRQPTNTTLSVSAIGFGAWGIGGPPFWKSDGDAASKRAIGKALDLGITLFDTAPVYGFGHSEMILGEVLKPYRDDIVLATKCGLRWERPEVRCIRKDATRQSIFEEIDDSLRRLRTDYIDLYQVHWPDPETPIEETMNALKSLQQSGKIRYFGVSNYSFSQLKESIKFGSVATQQVQYNLLYRSIEKEVIPYCREHAIGVLAYSPLASGVLTGKYDKSTHFSDWRAKGILGDFTGNAYERNIEKVQELSELAQSSGKSCGQLAINWLLSQSGVTSALVGVKNQDHLIHNIESIGWQLSDRQSREIERIFR